MRCACGGLSAEKTQQTACAVQLFMPCGMFFRSVEVFIADVVVTNPEWWHGGVPSGFPLAQIHVHVAYAFGGLRLARGGVQSSVAQRLRPLVFGEVLYQQARAVAMRLVAEGVVDRSMARECATLTSEVLVHDRVREVGAHDRDARERLEDGGCKQTVHFQDAALAVLEPAELLMIHIEAPVVVPKPPDEVCEMLVDFVFLHLGKSGIQRCKAPWFKESISFVA